MNYRKKERKNICPSMKFNCALTRLHEADDDATNWLNNTAMPAFAK